MLQFRGDSGAGDGHTVCVTHQRKDPADEPPPSLSI